MSPYGWKPKSARIILALAAPLKWAYWTNQRSRLFRRQMAAARYFRSYSGALRSSS